jgi:hypothetical protein
VAEDGVRYVPPLRPAPNAPATSWNAAAYDPASAPSAQVTPSAQVKTAVPAAVGDNPSPTPAKKVPSAKKTKTAAHKKPVKKPSQDRAAPGS